MSTSSSSFNFGDKYDAACAAVDAKWADVKANPKKSGMIAGGVVLGILVLVGTILAGVHFQAALKTGALFAGQKIALGAKTALAATAKVAAAAAKALGTTVKLGALKMPLGAYIGAGAGAAAVIGGGIAVAVREARRHRSGTEADGERQAQVRAPDVGLPGDSSSTSADESFDDDGSSS